MKKSKRFFLPADDFDPSLLKIHLMRWRGYDFPSPAEIVGGTTPREIARTVRNEDRRVLLRSLNK